MKEESEKKPDLAINESKFEMIDSNDYEKFVQDTLENGLSEYLETGDLSESIHRSRELRYISPLLEAQGKLDLAEKFQQSIKEFAEEYAQKEDSNYLIGLYMKELLTGERNPLDTSSEPQRLGVFTYGRAIIDPTEDAYRIEEISIQEILQTIKKLKDDYPRFKEHMDLLKYRDGSNIPKILSHSMYYPGLLDGKSPQMFFKWSEIKKNDVSLSGEDNITDEDMKDFVMLKSHSMGEIIKRDLGINLSGITLPEQFQFLKLVKGKNASEIDRVRDFLHKFSTSGLRSFLSMEQDSDMGEVILDLGDELDTKSSMLIFSKYSEIVFIAETAHEYINHQIKEGINPEDIGKIKNGILKRGKDILIEMSKEGKDMDVQEVLSYLDKIRRDALLLTESLKNVKDLKIENIANVSIETQSPESLDDSDKDTMKKLYSDNYNFSPKFRDVLLNDFEHNLENPESQIHLFKNNDNIKGFYALVPTKEKKKKFTAFNIDPSYKGARIGEEMMLNGLDKEAETNIIEAACDGNSFISSAYIERGFIATETFSPEDGPKNSLSLLRNDSLNSKLETKLMTNSEVKIAASKQILNMEKLPRKFFILSQMTDYDYDQLKRKENDDPWILTRSIADRKTGETYLAYEQVDDEFIDFYSTEI